MGRSQRGTVRARRSSLDVDAERRAVCCRRRSCLNICLQELQLARSKSNRALVAYLYAFAVASYGAHHLWRSPYASSRLSIVVRCAWPSSLSSLPLSWRCRRCWPLHRAHALAAWPKLPTAMSRHHPKLRRLPVRPARQVPFPRRPEHRRRHRPHARVDSSRSATSPSGARQTLSAKRSRRRLAPSARSRSRRVRCYGRAKSSNISPVSSSVSTAPTGKANQYYLRGFQLDHGTNLEAQINGVPVNLGSHAHGQGYSDINYLIPEPTVIMAQRQWADRMFARVSNWPTFTRPPIT